MSGVYLYCIGREDHPSPERVAGIEDAPVEAGLAAGFALWTSPLAASPSPSLDRIRRHNDVVEQAAATVTPLPLRFGQWFASLDELERALADRAPALRRALDRVAGGVEFGVRVLDPGLETPPPDRSSGRAYLEALARRDSAAEHARARAAEIADRVRDWMGPLVREQRLTPLGTAGGLAALAHLVDRHDTGSYGARVRELPDRHPTLRFLFSGPWPPYGFVDREADDG